MRISSQTSRSAGFQENNVMTVGQDSETEVQVGTCSRTTIGHAERTVIMIVRSTKLRSLDIKTKRHRGTGLEATRVGSIQKL